MPAPEGNNFAVGNPGGGAPESNTNARTIGLYMKEKGYIERQSESDQEWILELTESLVDMWRKRHGGKPPKAIRQRLESIAIDCHRVAWADDYFASEGLTQMRQEVVGDETITAEKLTLWAGEIRKYNSAIASRLDRHGLFDPPEDRTAGPQPGDTFASEHVEITFVGDGEESDELADDVDDD